MVLWPKQEGEMTEFLRWLTLTHSQRLHAHRRTAGYGHIYQGRFKSFPVEQDQAALNVIRYVECSALRANLVDKAQDWRWCSLWRKVHGDRESLLNDWPVDKPADWVEWVNAAQNDAEIEALRKCVNRGTPYGTETWKTQIAASLGLKYTLQPRGRPRKVVGLADTQT
jgi:putative transposase